MAKKQIFRMVVDVGMTVLLLLLMTFELIGDGLHEWLGIGMFVLFVIHHILNRKWTAHLLKGKYSPFRILQTVLVCIILLTMLGSMYSGMVMSRYVLPGVIPGSIVTARSLHMICAYWGFVFMSLHLGLHWNAMMAMARKHLKPSEVRAWLLRILGLAIAGYGIVAFAKRDIGSYLFLKTPFVFFDFSEPLIFFLLDYLAIMGLFVCVGHYLARALNK